MDFSEQTPFPKDPFFRTRRSVYFDKEFPFILIFVSLVVFEVAKNHRKPQIFAERLSEVPLEGPTRKLRHATVFSTLSDLQAVPAFHCIRMFFKGIFSTRAFLKRTDTLSTIA